MAFEWKNRFSSNERRKHSLYSIFPLFHKYNEAIYCRTPSATKNEEQKNPCEMKHDKIFTATAFKVERSVVFCKGEYHSRNFHLPSRRLNRQSLTIFLLPAMKSHKINNFSTVSLSDFLDSVENEVPKTRKGGSFFRIISGFCRRIREEKI